MKTLDLIEIFDGQRNVIYPTIPNQPGRRIRITHIPDEIKDEKVMREMKFAIFERKRMHSYPELKESLRVFGR